MAGNDSFARQLRMRRLYHQGDGRLLIVPLDHSVTEGPLTRGSLDSLIGRIAGTGVDAVVLHKGSLRRTSGHWFAAMSLIVHLSASTMHAPDPDAKYLVAGVEDALRLGADAVSVHVNLGSSDERRQIADLAAVASSCDRWNLPLIAMVYPRGPQISDPRDPELIAHAITLAADLGADVVKTVYAHSADEMRDVISASPIPALVAGGPSLGSPAKVLSYVSEVLGTGVTGLAMGRNIFQAPEPATMAHEIAGLVHPAISAESVRPELAASAH